MLRIKFDIFNKHKFNEIRKYCKNIKQNEEIASGYRPSEVERRQQNLCVNQQKCKSLNGKTFTMLLPPPNVTGQLHLGHALMCTIQDVLARWKRAEGYDVLWIPGTDHAGIATQLVVEKKLLKERGQTRHTLGRSAFLDEIWQWKRDKGDRIKYDIKKLGTTLNWDREYFTMDKSQSEAVNEAFIRLFDDNLIYRSDSLINWSCALESAIADIEVDTIEISTPTRLSVPGYSKPILFGQIIDVAYKVHGDPTTEIIVSTTRPETILGDVAVAVHPNDSRYTDLLNKQVHLIHPFQSGTIPLVADTGVDMNFGSGAVKITPAHDKFDFEVARKCALPSISVINEKGMICDGLNERFSGLPRFIAREQMLNELSDLGLMRSIKTHKIQLPICSRSQDIIEYLLKPQWFLRCKEMAEKARSVVECGQIEIHPSQFQSEWNRWLDNIQDWCLSRQVWWGHQIPAYRCTTATGKITWIAAHNKEIAMLKATQQLATDQFRMEQDTDVLDTWFSSALLPFSCMGWPSRISDHKRYPMDVMETGHDILFFWVARMVMLGLHFTGTVPFKRILLHGIVCDAHGRKMSKSLGNVIYPEQVIGGASLEELHNETRTLYHGGILSQSELNKSLDGQMKLFPNGIPECGTDALRFTLASHNIKSHFINFDISECYTNKLFFNKIWQATRYTINLQQKFHLDSNTEPNLDSSTLSPMDLWFLSRLSQTIQTVHNAMDDYNFHLATNSLRTFFYSTLCDVYLETTKTREDGHICADVLRTGLTVGLNLMNSFTPFLCAELLQYLPKECRFEESKWLNQSLENTIEKVLEICLAIRQVKSKENITKKQEPQVYLFIQDKQFYAIVKNHIQDMIQLTQSKNVIVECKDISDSTMKNQFLIKSTAGHLCSFGIVTNDGGGKAAATRTNDVISNKKLEKLQKELEKLLKTVSNDGYQRSANEKVQQKHSEKIKQLKIEIANIEIMDKIKVI